MVEQSDLWSAKQMLLQCSLYKLLKHTARTCPSY